MPSGRFGWVGNVSEGQLRATQTPATRAENINTYKYCLLIPILKSSRTSKTAVRQYPPLNYKLLPNPPAEPVEDFMVNRVLY